MLLRLLTGRDTRSRERVSTFPMLIALGCDGARKTAHPVFSETKLWLPKCVQRFPNVWQRFEAIVPIVREQVIGGMGDDARSGSGGAEWEETIRKALLQQRQREEAGEEEGDGEELDPSEVENLKVALGRVTATWRKRTQGQRLSAQRWIEREAHVDRRAQWRKDLAEVLEATWTHVAIVVLLLVDLAATAADILKTIHNKSHDLDVCVALVESCTTCIGHFERSEEWKWTYWTSIVILAILMLNLFGLIVAFGRSFFFNPLYVLDLVVVSTALGLEILLDADTAGLIIILTLWRIVRVAHGIFEVTDEAWEKNIHQLEMHVKAVQDAYDKDQELLKEKDRQIAEQDKRISKLEARLGDSNDYMSSRYE